MPDRVVIARGSRSHEENKYPSLSLPSGEGASREQRLPTPLLYCNKQDITIDLPCGLAKGGGFAAGILSTTVEIRFVDGTHVSRSAVRLFRAGPTWRDRKRRRPAVGHQKLFESWRC